MKRFLIVLVVLLLLPGIVMAAPGWQVTKPPVLSGANPATGPDNDSNAVLGQWFIPRTTPLPSSPNRIGVEVRPWEFYDDSAVQGGGTASFGAIKSGSVVYYDWDGGTGYGTGSDGIMDSFGIQISVTNDTPAMAPKNPYTNLHGETWGSGSQWDCNMRGVKVTAEFALDINNGFPTGAGNPPYVSPGLTHYEAVNHTDLAWYCYNTDPRANFWVPAWDLGDIGHGQTATVEMQFYVGNAGILAQGQSLRTWLDNTSDKFYNRTQSLKISDWANMCFGPPTSYDSNYEELSNVSVFFVPEPSTLTMLGLTLVGIAAAYLWRRRRP